MLQHNIDFTVGVSLGTCILGGGGGFNPETDITWHSLFWTGGTDFLAQGYADSDPVTTWPNETGEADATEATNPPTLRDPGTGLNSQPVVYQDGLTNHSLSTGAFSVAPDYTNGVSVVSIVYPFSQSRYYYDGLNETTGRNASYRATSWQYHAGTLRSSGISTTVGTLIVDHFPGDGGGGGYCDVDGVRGTTLSPGTGKLTGLNFQRATTTQRTESETAFRGIYEGDFTTDASYSDFTT